MSDAVSSAWLATRVPAEDATSTSGAEILILDCRCPDEFGRLHINGSLNVTLPSILHKRLLKGTLSAASAISATEVREWFLNHPNVLSIVLVPESSSDQNGNQQQQWSEDEESANQVSQLLLKAFRADGSSAFILKGGLDEFLREYPELCWKSGQRTGPVPTPSTSQRPSHLGPLFSLQTLSLDTRRPKPLDSCYSSPEMTTADYKKLNGRQNESQFPVQILPYLFLGNAHNSADRAVLDRYDIRYILNVTPNLPNAFEEDAEFKYLQIPISDHWSQNLASYFPSAIAFIEEARAKKKGVLVHCLAGISRSVTVTVAYLMQKMGKSMDDAYELVKDLKPNIAPNFNFMGQLLDLERELNGASPDSGRSSASSADDSHASFHHSLHFISPTTLTLPPLRRKNNTLADSNTTLTAAQ